MEHSFKDYRDNSKEKHTLTFFIFIIFIAVLIFLTYTYFKSPESSPLTGNIIKSPEGSAKIPINARLTAPENMRIDVLSEKISLKTKSTSLLQLGNQKIELNPKSSIIIENFEGEMVMNLKNASELEGRTSKIYIDGIPIIPSKKETISFEQGFDYSFLRVDNVQTSLGYTASGNININNEKIRIKLENEKISIKNFEGSLELTSGELQLSGFVPKSEAKGFVA